MINQQCPKCYDVLERTPKRTIQLAGAQVTVLSVCCPGCGRTYDDDYDVQPIVSDPVAWAERRRQQQRASQQRHLKKLRAAFRAARG